MIGIPWNLTDNNHALWSGDWYSLHDSLFFFLEGKSNGTPSSDLMFNLIFGIDSANNPLENMDGLALEREINVQSRSLLRLTAKYPLRQIVSCVSQGITQARYKAQASPSSDTYLPLLAFRRTLADLRLHC
jgi:hypothetical protein